MQKEMVDLFEKGMILLNKGNYAEAEMLFLKARKISEKMLQN